MRAVATAREMQPPCLAAARTPGAPPVLGQNHLHRAETRRRLRRHDPPPRGRRPLQAQPPAPVPRHPPNQVSVGWAGARRGPAYSFAAKIHPRPAHPSNHPIQPRPNHPIQRRQPLQPRPNHPLQPRRPFPPRLPHRHRHPARGLVTHPLPDGLLGIPPRPIRHFPPRPNRHPSFRRPLHSPPRYSEDRG